MFDWEDLRYFCTFAGAGSLSAAAKLLSVDHATVARRISSLEKSLKLKLLDRRQRLYLLTENGHRVFSLAVQLSESAFAIERAAGAERCLRRSAHLSTLIGSRMYSKLAWLSNRIRATTAAKKRTFIERWLK